MKDVSGTLKRIDEEIVGHKQAIARHQIEIVRLQDTRSVLMGIVEDDMATAEAARMSDRAALLAGHGSKPMIVVRKATEDEAPPPSATMHARTNGHAKSEKPKKRKRSANSESGMMRDKIMKVMDGTPMSSREIGDFLGLPRDEASRKAMSNALYQLKVKGELIRDAENRYNRPAAA